MSVIFETSVGDLTIDLFVDECPKTAKNFLKLCKIKYYDHCLFHNIQKDFTVQTGDPTGTGQGGSSIEGVLIGEKYRFFKDEISPRLKHDKKGLVAMASAGKDMNASQFYITTSDRLPRLDGKHTIFGEVVEGFETLSKINEAVVNLQGRPLQVLRIQHTIVLDDPFEDPEGLVVPDRSPSPPRRWPADLLPEDLNLDDESEESRIERLAEQAAQAKAEALVMIGELPDADVKPPENVLFVCKLNPLTTGPSLSIPFTRFGNVKSCEVIKDRHGNSLCYAFVEFEDKVACEEAYLKMQNVLIDGRRIHVDFSQSVSKTVDWKASGGWKKFFAESARLHNDQDAGGAKLEFKRGAPMPVSFTKQRTNQDDRRHDREKTRDAYKPNDYDRRSYHRRDDDDRGSYRRDDDHDRREPYKPHSASHHRRDDDRGDSHRYDDRRDSHRSDRRDAGQYHDKDGRGQIDKQDERHGRRYDRGEDYSKDHRGRYQDEYEDKRNERKRAVDRMPEDDHHQSKRPKYSD